MTIMRVYAEALLRRAQEAPMIKAIRSDPLVGEGTGSSIDETMGDEELIEELNADGITDPAAAVKWARELELLWLEQGTNASSGEPDCPLVAAYERFEKLMKEIPVNAAQKIMRVYAEGVLRRAQEDSAVEDAKAALQAAGTPLLNLIEEAQAIYTHPAAHPAPIIQFVNDVYDFVQNKMQGYAKGDPITPAYLARVIPDANNAIEFIQAWQQNYPAGAEFIPAIQAYSDATDNLVAALESTTKAPEQPGQQQPTQPAEQQQQTMDQSAF